MCSLPIGPRPFAGIADGEGSRPRPKILDDGQYAESSFAGPEQVLTYLSRYTHRIAISNRRLVALDDTHVAFPWRDYAHGGAQKVMRLEAREFIRRFLQHVLPDGFQRIRHYGLLANGHRKSKLMAIRTLLLAAAPPPGAAGPSGDKLPAGGSAEAAVPCPCCGGIMTIIEILPGPRGRQWPRLDTS
ncbi:MAG TPA: transposase [Candidatus Acidoferrales bacterium]|nr:transposase [Candidatus Acidoferrales bacterium]